MRNLCSLFPNSNFPFVFTFTAFLSSDCAVFISKSYSSPVMLPRSLSIFNNSGNASLADQAGMTGAAKPPISRAH